MDRLLYTPEPELPELDQFVVQAVLQSPEPQQYGEEVEFYESAQAEPYFAISSPFVLACAEALASSTDDAASQTEPDILEDLLAIVHQDEDPELLPPPPPPPTISMEPGLLGGAPSTSADPTTTEDDDDEDGGEDQLDAEACKLKRVKENFRMKRELVKKRLDREVQALDRQERKEVRLCMQRIESALVRRQKMVAIFCFLFAFLLIICI